MMDDVASNAEHYAEILSDDKKHSVGPTLSDMLTIFLALIEK